MNDDLKPMSRLLCIGVGNEFRRDDDAGLIVARRLREARLPHVDIIEESGEGARLMQTWAGYDTVILIDATCSGAKAGTIHRFEAHRVALPSRFFSYSTHAFSVAESIEMARVLRRLPQHLLVFGIEGQDFATGRGLSQPVCDGVDMLVKEIEKLIHAAVA